MKVVFISGIVAAMAAPCVAWATPRPLPFTYPYETLNEGSLELEVYTDVNPLRVAADATDPTRGNVWAPEYKLQTEFEYGLTDHVELGFYQVFDAPPVPGGDNAFLFDGLKWRVRARLVEPGQWPVDLGLYFELETMHDEWSLEAKLNLQRRFGALRWMANLWVEEALRRPFDRADQGRGAHFILNPTTGVTLQVTPAFHPGVEFWARGEIDPSGTTDQEHQNSRVHYYVGPTAHLNFGRMWLSAGLYAHLNNSQTPKPSTGLQGNIPGDIYGPIWFRSVLGMDL